MGDVPQAGACDDASMLTDFSNQLADVVEAAASSIVQVQGRRRPASGIVYGPGIVVTIMKALGRDDGLRIRRHDGVALDAELAGWDPATSLAVLRVPGLEGQALSPSASQARIGHLALAVGRSWSNGLTASAGIVSIIGGPLPTGRRRAIDQVIRVTAPMHDGFAGGACLDVSGELMGVATASTIRGLGVIIPGDIAWRAAASVLEHGRMKRGYLGVAGQPVTLPDAQRGNAEHREEALLVVAVTAASPAASAGLLVGDVILSLDGQPIEAPEDLLDLLVGDRVGRQVTLHVLRGGAARDLVVTVGERPQG